MRKFNIYITIYCLLEVLLVIIGLLRLLYPEQIAGWGSTILVLAICGAGYWISRIARRIPVKRGDPVIRLSKNHGHASTIVIVIFAVGILRLIRIPDSFMIVLTVAFVAYVALDYFIALRKITAKKS